jgi:cob(I)alamin adenosyltransferase
MPIYTKTGDNGTTALFGGKRRMKCDIQVEAYGTVDELSSFLGLLISKVEDRDLLIGGQKDLYLIMAVLSNAPTELKDFDQHIVAFEKKIDEIQESLPPLTRFILPGGNEISSLCHIVRTVCRRAERKVVELYNDQPNQVDPIIIMFLNRLSDLLFILARMYGKNEEIHT